MPDPILITFVNINIITNEETPTIVYLLQVSDALLPPTIIPTTNASSNNQTQS